LIFEMTDFIKHFGAIMLQMVIRKH